MQLGYFMNDPQQGKQIKIEIVNRRPKDKPYGDLMMPLIGEMPQARMQDPGSGADLPDRAGARHRAAGRPQGTTAEPNRPGADAVWLERPVQPAAQYDAVGRRARAATGAAAVDGQAPALGARPIPASPPSAPASPPARFPASPA